MAQAAATPRFYERGGPRAAPRGFAEAGSTGDRNALAFWGVHDENWPGVLLLAAVMFGLYRAAAWPTRELRAE